MIARLRVWLRQRATKRAAARFDSGWDWAAGQLLRGRSEEDVLRGVDQWCWIDDTPDPFDIGARAAVRAHAAHAYLEAQYRLFKPICG